MRLAVFKQTGQNKAYYQNMTNYIRTEGIINKGLPLIKNSMLPSAVEVNKVVATKHMVALLSFTPGFAL